MADLRELEPAPTVGTVTYQGVIVAGTGSGLAVNVNGNVIPARWADPLVVTIGDPVLVDIRTGPGQGEAIVRCRLTTSPRPAEGTVKTVPPSSVTITVTGTDGVDYTAKFVSSYTPTVNDNVILSWNAATPTVQGKVGAVAAPVSSTAAVAPPTITSGKSTYPATDSDTYWATGGWGSWAGGGGHVYQGDYGSGPVYGSWFYGGSPTELSGRTITSMQITLGARRSVGASSSPVTLHLYAHTSSTKPSGDVSRTGSSYDVTIQPGAGPQTIDLPLSFASTLQAGGGISLSGNPYAGVNGRYTQPDSGALTINWTR